MKRKILKLGLVLSGKYPVGRLRFILMIVFSLYLVMQSGHSIGILLNSFQVNPYATQELYPVALTADWSKLLSLVALLACSTWLPLAAVSSRLLSVSGRKYAKTIVAISLLIPFSFVFATPFLVFAKTTATKVPRLTRVELIDAYFFVVIFVLLLAASMPLL